MSPFCLFRRTLLVLLFSSLSAANSRAQAGDPVAAAQVPVPGVGHHYIGIGVETVNPADGSLTFDLPIDTPPGRMLNFPFGIHYSSSEMSGLGTQGSWSPQSAPPDDLNGWTYGLPTYLATATVTGSAPGPACQPYPSCSQTEYCWGASNYIFSSTPDGPHPLPLTNTWADPGNNMNIGCSASGSGPASGGNGILATMVGAAGSPQQPPLSVANRKGTVYQFAQGISGASSSPTTWSMIAQTITDRNGNQLVLTGQNSYLPARQGVLGAGYYTDTIGRKVVSWTGIGSTTGDQLTISGLPSAVVLKWASNNFTFHSQTYYVSGTTNGPSCSLASQNNTFALSTVTEMDLPNGQKYTFVYGGTWGRLTKIIFPDGGYVRYVWGVNQNSPTWNSTTNSGAAQTSWIDSNNNQQNCYYTYDTLKITDRYVSFDGSTEVLHQTFQYQTNWTTNTANGEPYWSSKTTTVNDTDLLTNQVTKTIYTYGSVPATGAVTLGCTGGNCAGSFTWPQLVNQIPVEVSVLYQNGSGSTLKTVNKTWLDQYGMIGEQTVLDNGQGMTTLRCLDGYDRVLASYQYGFQSEGSKPADPSCSLQPTAPAAPSGSTLSYGLNTSAIGPFKRYTITAYHAFSGTNILDDPDSVTVYDGSGTQVKQRSFTYTESVVSSGTAAGLVSPPGLRGNVSTVTHWLNTGGSSPVTSYTYFDTGQVQSMTDPCGNTACSDMTGSNHTTTYSYADNFASGTGTPSGQTNAYLTQVTHPNTGVAHVETFSWGYNDGLLRSHTDQNSQPTTYTYNTPPTGCSFSDGLNRLSTITYPDGGNTKYCYNDTPYNSSTPSPNVTTTRAITSTTNVTSLVAFDGLGHTVRSVLTSDPDCASGDRTDMTYDGLGRTYAVSNPYCTTSDSTYGSTSYAYDALGRATQVTEPDGSVITMSYSGNTTTVTDEAGKKRQNTTDALSRVTQVVEDPGGLGYVTNYTYDALDNLLSVVQNGSRQRTFAYDSLARLTSASNPESGTTTYSYDANGNLTGKTDARNVSVGYCYDALNRLACKTYSPTFAIGYYYDQTTWGNWTLTNPIGRLTSEGTYDGTCWPTYSIFGYDTMGRVSFQEDYLNTAETSGCPGAWSTISANYDLAGNQTSLTYPSGRVIKSRFSGANRLINVNVDDFSGYNYLSSANYAPFGSRTTFALGNGATETSSYNKRLQPLTLQLANTSTTLMNHTYNFNAGHDNGNVLNINDNLTPALTQNFSYDSLNRLSTAQTTGTSGPNCWGQQFGYDAWGNLLTETPNVSGCPTNMLSLGVNANNQITNTGFAYDAAGNMTNDGTNTYAFDAENHLTSLNSGAATYIYDAQGRRMAKKIGSATTEYIYFNGDVLAEYNPGDLLWNDYIFAGARRLAAAGTDDILNPGFEQGMEAWQWGTSDPSGTAQVITDPTRAHSGNNYLQLSSTTAVSVSAGQLVSVNPGDQLTFGGWAYIEPGSASGGVIAWDIAVLDASGNVLAYYGSAVTSTGVWTYLSTNYTVPSGAASVSLYCQIYQPTGLTTARFDDAFLTGASGLGVRYYHADHLGSARLMTDASGNQTWSATYLPFGQEWNPQPTANHYKFTGKERDSESGLDNFGARYYPSPIGRWLSPDIINLTSSRLINPGNTLNKYVYAADNPLKFIDRDGQDITIFYRPSSGTFNMDFGHLFIGAVNQKTQQVGFLDFYPKGSVDSSGKGPGAFNLGNMQDRAAQVKAGQFATLTIQTTPEVAQKVLDLITALQKGDAPGYAALSKNCTTVCEDVLRDLGLDFGDILPSSFFLDAVWKFNPQALFRYTVRDVPAPIMAGSEYGNPRNVGMNYSQWLFQLYSNQFLNRHPSPPKNPDPPKPAGTCPLCP